MCDAAFLITFASSNPDQDDSTYFGRMTADICHNDSRHFDDNF